MSFWNYLRILCEFKQAYVRDNSPFPSVLWRGWVTGMMPGPVKATCASYCQRFFSGASGGWKQGEPQPRLIWKMAIITEIGRFIDSLWNTMFFTNQVVMVSSLFTTALIVHIGLQGTVINPYPRRRMSKLFIVKVMIMAALCNTTTPQLFYGHFSGTTQLSRCQKRTSRLLVQGKINRGRHIDNPAGRHSIQLTTAHLHNPPMPYVIEHAIIFLPCDFYLVSFFSLPNLSGWRLDVYHTSTYGVALVRI